jgi:hypothetical protein
MGCAAYRLSSPRDFMAPITSEFNSLSSNLSRSRKYSKLWYAIEGQKVFDLALSSWLLAVSRGKRFEISWEIRPNL